MKPRKRIAPWGVARCLLPLIALARMVPAAEPAKKPAPPAPAAADAEGWRALFDGKSLTGWKIAEEGELATHGEIAVKDGAIRLGAGMPFSAVKFAGAFPTEDFEVSVEAMRASGSDIFCGLTFPVGPAGSVSFVLGGWGDTVVGLSCVDGELAANNETMKTRGFDNNKWYTVRARVSAAAIEAWIDDQKMVDLRRIGRRLEVYSALDSLPPFGVFAWRSEAALRNIRVRPLGTAALPPLPGEGWKPLGDGKTLEGWKVVAEGERDAATMARAVGGLVLCEQGADLTGVAWKGDFPTTHYEVALDAMRVDGSDFFCGMTFPVAKSFATLIVGGWGGTVVGLSNVNGLNASENETTRDIVFAKDRWYRIRLRVTPDKIEAWIDKDQVVNLETKDKTLTVWLQQEAYKPFGLNAWQTKAALRNIVLRKLADAKKEEPKK